MIQVFNSWPDVGGCDMWVTRPKDATCNTKEDEWAEVYHGTYDRFHMFDPKQEWVYQGKMQFPHGQKEGQAAISFPKFLQDMVYIVLVKARAWKRQGLVALLLSFCLKLAKSKSWKVLKLTKS